MGSVYLASRTDEFRQQVALKVIRKGIASDELVRRFRLERQLLASLNHPAIARLLDGGTTEEGLPYLVMEYIDGRPLDEHARAAKLDARGRAHLLLEVCAAVEYAHQRGVIHRDLKPGNILVDAQGRPKVLDFGVARVLDAELAAGAEGGTQAGQIVGTVPYMSPEQTEADPYLLDTRSDVYTLGVILYELLAGRLPYELKGKSNFDKLVVIRETEPTPLPREAGVHRDLAAIVGKTLEKTRERRYGSTTELAADVRRWLTGEPTVARPPARLERLARWVRRYPLVVALIAALALGIVGSAAATVAAIGQRDRAVEAERETLTLLARSHVDAARLAMERGLWREALDFLDRAQAAGYDDQAELALERIRALVAVAESAGVEPELARLTELSLSAVQKGRLCIEEAEQLHGVDDDKALAKFREALTSPLPDVARHYCLAHLADTSPEALAKLEQVLQLDPRHHRARVYAAMLTLLLGRLDDAHQHLDKGEVLYPEDPNLPLLRAAAFAVRGRTDDAQRTLAITKRRFPKEVGVQLDLVVEILGVAGNIEQVMYGDFTSQIKTQLLLARVLAALPQGRFKQPEQNPVPSLNATVMRFRYPPIIQRGIMGLVRALSFLALQGSRRAERIAEAAELERAHPEAVLILVHAMLKSEHIDALNAAGKLPDDVAALRDLFAHFDRAAHTPGFLNVRVPALDLAISVAMTLASPRRAKPQPDMEREAVRLIRERLAIRSLKAVGHEVPLWRIYVVAARLTQEFELGRTLLIDWERHMPNEVHVHYERARIEQLAGNHLQAIRSARKFLEKQPNDQPMQQVIEECTKKLKAELAALSVT
jgi:tetratricopeptide (TPR) repeat protein